MAWPRGPRARRNPRATIVAVDWPSVLQVAQENAAASGVSHRYDVLPGNAFEVDLGSGYDLILLTNFLHHFDLATNIQFLKKVYSALKTGGRAIAYEFVPDENRISPPVTAKFAMIMLAATPRGDAYPFSAFQEMFRAAGFMQPELVRIPGPESLVVARR